MARVVGSDKLIQYSQIYRVQQILAIAWFTLLVERCGHRLDLSNQTTRDDEMVWVISTCARVSKYMGQYRNQSKYIRSRLQMIAWSVHVTTDIH